MIPIGAPVTATRISTEGTDVFQGTLTDILTRIAHKPIMVMNDLLFFLPKQVKIRYDLAAPFTLWQLNVLAQEDANNAWSHEPQQLAPNHIWKYWEWSKFTLIKINPIKPMIRYTHQCPFTLWQLNVLLGAVAMDTWCDEPWLDHESIGYAWHTFRNSRFVS